ncbi:MAG: hypothetical protein HY814_01260 [Candidatus Riflebacteria bacterium]|nr:hypothetical protein [Candidatus Riflebacteria bacterium]
MSTTFKILGAVLLILVVLSLVKKLVALAVSLLVVLVLLSFIFPGAKK